MKEMKPIWNGATLAVKQVKKRIATLAVCLAIMMTANTMTAYAATGMMTVGGTTVSDISIDASGTGWTWTAGTATLALTSVYGGGRIMISCAATDAINLTYTGSVSISSATSYGIYCNGILNLSGSGGDLNVAATGTAGGISAENGITISGGNVNVETANGTGIVSSIDVSITGSANVTVLIGGTGNAGINGANVNISTTGDVSATSVTSNNAISGATAINISSGNITATTNGTVRTITGSVRISGGTVKLTNTGTGGAFLTQPRNSAGGTFVYLATLTLDGVNAETAVTGITAPAGYGISGVKTDAAGKLYFWLPEGNQTVTLTAGGNTYTGTVDVTSNNSNPATATLTAAGGGGQTTTITAGTFTAIYGNSGTATVPAADFNTGNNTLTLGNGTTGPVISGTPVVGGQASSGSTGNANTNALTINGGTSFTGTGYIDLYGGHVVSGGGSGNADNNTVTINGFTQTSDNIIVYGGRTSASSGGGNASGNQVSIASGSTNNFYGIYCGYSVSGNAAGNTVTINGGGQIRAVVGGNANGSGNAGGSGAGNTVNINGGSATVNGGVIGGQSASGFAGYNEVNIGSGYTGTIGASVAGGWVQSSPGGNAEHNSVTIAGGALSGNVIGGHSTGGAAANNSVTITGGTFGGDIRGGSASFGSATATNNTVTITATGKSYQDIYGGYNMGSTTGDLFTGNTFNCKGENLTVAGLYNFEYLNFYLPATTTNNATLLTATTATDLTGVTVDLQFATTDPSLAAGNTITLINGVTGAFTQKSITLSGQTYVLSVSSGNLIATVGGADVTPPALTAGAVNRTGDANATVKFTSDKAGTYYYQIEGTAPSAISLVAAGTNATTMTAAEQTVSLTALTAGAHTIYIAAKDAAGNVSNLLTITVPAYSGGGVTVSPSGIYAFSTETYGYDHAALAKQFTITNTGTGTITGLAVSLSASSDFEISSALSTATVASGGTATFSIRPKARLSANASPRTDAVTIRWNEDSGTGLTVNLSFTVNPKAITVTANSGQSTYGNNPSNPGISATGLVNGESVSVLSDLSNNFNISATTPPASYSLEVIGNLTNSNYIVTARYMGIWRVYKVAGAAVSGVPTLRDLATADLITVSAVTIPNNQGNQAVEYAISTFLYAGEGMQNTLTWQSGTTFTGPFTEGTYYVYARSAANEYYAAGTAQISDAIVLNLTGIDDVQPAKTLIVWVQNDRLYVSGLTPGTLWSVYNISGMLMYRSVAESDKADISLPAQGVYIVRSGEDTVKTKN